MIRKLEFHTIYNVYLNESPFKYYISILGGVGGPEFWKTCLYDTCTPLLIEAFKILLKKLKNSKKLKSPPQLVLVLLPNNIITN